MTTWEIMRFLHLAGIAFFIGGQLMLVVAVVPGLKSRGGDDAVMRAVAKRFGIGSAVALLVIVATGVAMAAEFDSWDRSELQVKLMLLVLVVVLVALHVVSPKARAISWALVISSLAIVWFGLELAHG